MKKTFLLLGVALLLAACNNKDYIPSKDKDLDGEKAELVSPDPAKTKIFVLNEGGMGSNNASLDFLRISDGKYVTGAFKKMNPEIGAGLGDVGNDIAINGDEVWIIVNNSGLVEVISAIDETEITAIAVPTPRNIAFDSNNAYVTSWAGAYANGTYDANGNYSITDSKNIKGQVYRIDLKTKAVTGSIEVGYQPEGIACYNGKIYVANSGGISCQLPPDYSYDNTVSIIDAASWKVTQTVPVEVNLKNVYSDGKGVIYVTTLGDYWATHSGLYYFYADNPTEIHKAGKGQQKPGDLQVSYSCISGDTVYCVATKNEFDWNAEHVYYIWSFAVIDNATDQGRIILYPQELKGSPYGLGVLDHHGDDGGHYLFVGDAGDFFNPGTVSCYAIDFNPAGKRWTVNAGVFPGHFAIW